MTYDYLQLYQSDIDTVNVNTDFDFDCWHNVIIVWDDREGMVSKQSPLNKESVEEVIGRVDREIAKLLELKEKLKNLEF